VNGASADRLRAALARKLETGQPGWPARAASRAWEAWSERTLARPLLLPATTRVVGVGSAVLGGAGKTPLAVALVRALAALGARPALVGHAYRAHPRAPRVVLPDDRVGEVGDDALSAARLLGADAPVIVGPTRQAALDHAAARGHRVLVVDGLLQTRPRRLDASVLVLDALAPWGSGACPPAGDLRARRDALLRAADLVALVTGPDDPLPTGLPPVVVRVESRLGLHGSCSLDTLRGQRVGLFLAIAHPERVVHALARAGITRSAQRLLADHAVPSPSDLAFAERAEVDVWVTTARCSTKLPRAIAGRPVLALEHRLDVADLAAQVASRALG
jgi:tetraacyldisaccharide 4'-kinase